MDDLISRSVLKKAFSKNSIFEKITDARGMNVLEIIDEQPTAYDAEKVVEQLKGLKHCVCDDIACVTCKYTKDCLHGDESQNVAIDKAIELVRKGGVE